MAGVDLSQSRSFGHFISLVILIDRRLLGREEIFSVEKITNSCQEKAFFFLENCMFVQRK